MFGTCLVRRRADKRVTGLRVGRLVSLESPYAGGGASRCSIDAGSGFTVRSGSA